MDTNQKEHFLVTIGKEIFYQDAKKEGLHFAQNAEADKLLQDLEHFPHAFVLGCLMDRQIKAEKAWIIPYIIQQQIGSFEIDQLAKVKETEYQKIFDSETLHRFNATMATVFYRGVLRIKEQYNGDASLIWKKEETVKDNVVSRFRKFNGCGQKISTMAANILMRRFGIPLYTGCIDISADVHVKRVFKRTGLTDAEDKKQTILKARELNPEFPGIIDYACWKIGKDWCHPANPECENCIIRHNCTKRI
jgi:uncharacterized HhH-GPD family protein